MREQNRLRNLILIYLIPLVLFLNNCGSSGSGRSDTGSQSPNGDTTPPTVTSTSPANGGTQVPPNVIISATFSEPINANTLAGNFIVVNASAGTTVLGTVGYTPETMTATFTLTAPPLAINSTYTVTITNAVKDTAGNPMAASFSWSFTTGAAIDNSPPSFPGNDPQLSAQATSSSTISLSWVAASDNTTLPNQIQYVVCRSTVSTDCTVNPFPATGGNIVITEVPAGQTSLGVTGLNSNTTYYFVVRAKDQVNLLDGNVAQKSATTFGTFISLGGSLNANCTGTVNTKSCGQDAASPSIAIVGSIPYVAWSEGSSSPTVYIRTYNEATATWSAATSISSNSLYPQVASSGASSPVPYLTYTQTDTVAGQRNVFVRKWDGANWVLVGGGALNINDATDSVIAFDSNSVAHVAWSEKTGGVNQIYVKQYIEGQGWQGLGSLNGGSLNKDTAKFAFNPSIAINGSTIKAAWTECNNAQKNNCEIYVKTWNSSSGNWEPTNPTSLRDTFSGQNVQLEGTSISLINGDVYLAWPESGKGFIRKDSGSGFGTQEVISSSVQGSSNMVIKGTATSTQVPYLVYASTVNSNLPPPPNPPFLFVKRWDGNEWVTEGSGPINMTGGDSNASINSSIAFSGGTPYVAWTERGSCNLTTDPQTHAQVNPCQQGDTIHYQLYVKRLQ